MAEPKNPMALESNSSYYNLSSSRYGKVLCYSHTDLIAEEHHNGWESAKPIHAAFPFFIKQLLVANFVYRVIYYMTRPLHLPPFVAQILVSNQMLKTILTKHLY